MVDLRGTDHILLVIATVHLGVPHQSILAGELNLVLVHTQIVGRAIGRIGQVEDIVLRQVVGALNLLLLLCALNHVLGYTLFLFRAEVIFIRTGSLNGFLALSGANEILSTVLLMWVQHNFHIRAFLQGGWVSYGGLLLCAVGVAAISTVTMLSIEPQIVRAGTHR